MRTPNASENARFRFGTPVAIKGWRLVSMLVILAGGSLFDACSAHWHFALSSGGRDFLSQLLDPANYTNSRN